ncbi:MAG: hypothetical protein Q9191_004427 [Dirinaria sp. TL-2023a]
MGYDHLVYTIPPAILLTLLYYPLGTGIDIYKTLFLVTIAVVSTIPWDSYLIRNRVWTYPSHVIIGPTLFQIPAEEVFFFVIQTYNTSLLYLFVSKPTFHPVYLRGEQLLRHGRHLLVSRWLGTLAVAAGIAFGIWLVTKSGEGLYMGLILIWSGPFILLLWEAVFFLVTNVLIVFGLVAFDNALAVLHTFPALFPSIPTHPSPLLLIEALLVPPSSYDNDRIAGLQQALGCLKAKSRSFYLASGVFQGQLRIDLILLYSFCRVADDLVDDAASTEEARSWIGKLFYFLDLSYSDKPGRVMDYVNATFPPSARAALLLLPSQYLSPKPLYDLLKGFETDLHFKSASNPFPIKDLSALERYGARVAGTVAEACIELVYYHTTTPTLHSRRKQVVQAGGRMGVALQYINIARDVSVDASNFRVYFPLDWLKGCELVPGDVIRDPTSRKVECLRQQLLDNAMDIYQSSRGAIEQLPPEARRPMRVAVESYVEIGRVLREPGHKVKAGRATVPKWRRAWVAWKALNY